MLHDQGWQHLLGVFLNKLRRLLGHDDQGADHQKHRYKSKQDIANATNDGAFGGGIQTVGRHHALKHILLRNGAKHDGDGRCNKKQNFFQVGFREKIEHVLADGQSNHFVGTACLLSRKNGQSSQAHHQNDHLYEVGNGNRPHAPKQGVGQD